MDAQFPRRSSTVFAAPSSSSAATRSARNRGSVCARAGSDADARMWTCRQGEFLNLSDACQALSLGEACLLHYR